jgi:hypothetical protein
MPLASLELPYRAFPSRGAVPALAGLLLTCGFAFDRRQRRVLEKFTIAFAARAKLFALLSPPEGGPGRMSRDVGSSRSLVRSPRRA